MVVARRSCNCCLNRNVRANARDVFEDSIFEAEENLWFCDFSQQSRFLTGVSKK